MNMSDISAPAIPATGPSRECSESWLSDRDAQAAALVMELDRVLPPSAGLLVVDEGYLDLSRWVARRKFFRLDYGVHGPPAEAVVVRQYQQHRQAGADLVLVAWPALGWLERYPAWNALLLSSAESVRAGDGFVVLDLRPGPRTERERMQTVGEESLRSEIGRLQTEIAGIGKVRQTEHTREIERLRALELIAQKSLEQLTRKCADLKQRCHQLELLNDQQNWRLRVGRLIRAKVSPVSRLVIATGGDDALLELSPQPGWHFPQLPDGAHGGSPADGFELVTQIEALRERGATHLLLPAWLDWWLAFYPEFRDHLRAVGVPLVSDADALLFALADKAAPESPTPMPA